MSLKRLFGLLLQKWGKNRGKSETCAKNRLCPEKFLRSQNGINLKIEKYLKKFYTSIVHFNLVRFLQNGKLKLFQKITKFYFEKKWIGHHMAKRGFPETYFEKSDFGHFLLFLPIFGNISKGDRSWISGLFKNARFW